MAKRCGGFGDILLKVGAEFKIDNTYTLELQNSSRVLALPGDDETMRGLTVDGWIVADEAARLDPDLITALHPMRARCPERALCHAVNGMEAHRSILDGVDER